MASIIENIYQIHQEEGLVTMQAWSGSNVRETNTLTRKVITYTILLFSLAGLIVGFAFGGFTQLGATNKPGNTNAVIKNTVVVQATVNAPPTPTVQPIVPLGFPKFDPFPAPTETVADGTTYTIGIQVIDKQ